MVAALEQWPGSGVPANPGAWLTTVAKRRAIDLFRRNRELERKYAQIGREPADGVRPGRRGRHRRRHAPAHLHRVSSRSRRARPRGADPPPARRPDHGRDRPRLPGAGADDRAAHRPGQEDPGEREGAVRDAGQRAAAVPALVRPRGHVPHLQRGLFGHRRRGLDAAGPVPRGPPAGPPAGPARAGRTRGARAGRADGDPGVPDRGPHGAVRPAGAAARPGPDAVGPAAHQPRPGRPGPRRKARRRARSLRAAGRHRRMPRACLPGRGHRLGADHRAVRHPGRACCRHPWSS